MAYWRDSNTINNINVHLTARSLALTIGSLELPFGVVEIVDFVLQMQRAMDDCLPLRLSPVVHPQTTNQTTMETRQVFLRRLWRGKTTSLSIFIRVGIPIKSSSTTDYACSLQFNAHTAQLIETA